MVTAARLARVVVATLLVGGLAATALAQPRTRNVLILSSFEREFAPYSNYAQLFRSELNRRSPAPISFFEVSLQPALTPVKPREEETVAYLSSIFADQRLDLIVTVGGNAAAFVERYRARLFPATPVLQGALNIRRVPAPRPGDNATAVATTDNFPQLLQNALDVLPDTRHVFVVIGASPFEQFWIKEIGSELEPFKDRLTFEWSNELSLDEALARASSLAPHSVIFFVTVLVDAKGVVQTDERVLGRLHDVTNVPIFGQFDIQIGQGIVGGSMTMVTDASRRSVDVALRILDGEAAEGFGTQAIPGGQPTYDWRELQHWGISEARLPAGSHVLFRQPGAWDQYRVYIVAAGSALAVQSALIVGLFVQRARRRRAEHALRQSYEQNQDLAGRLISAQEEERARIARELHDDISQQLAGVDIMLSGLTRRITRPGSGADLDRDVVTLRERTGALADSIRALSHELHPAVLQHVGVLATLQRHCADLEEHYQVRVPFDNSGDIGTLGPDGTLCLFRIAQEALNNAVKHARATTIRVQLTAARGSVELRIEDDGVGFVAGQNSRSGLGLRSMDERARLVGGSLTLESTPGHGTRVALRVPQPRLTRSGSSAMELNVGLGGVQTAGERRGRA